jgi:hypothetical protein
MLEDIEVTSELRKKIDALDFEKATLLGALRVLKGPKVDHDLISFIYHSKKYPAYKPYLLITGGSHYHCLYMVCDLEAAEFHIVTDPNRNSSVVLLTIDFTNPRSLVRSELRKKVKEARILHDEHIRITNPY